MQRTDDIDERDLQTVIDAFFEEGGKMFEGSDTYDRISQEFHDTKSVCEYIQSQRAKGYVLVMLAFYDPAAQGYINVRETEVDPERFNGAKLRQSLEGWGLIYINLGFVDAPRVEVNISVNSQKRAFNWASTCHRMKSPDLWNWKLVERHARRGIRVLRKFALPA
ncbi:MAG: hypothetical protein AAGJ84_14935 [Pseudomonadota bacterium]